MPLLATTRTTILEPFSRHELAETNVRRPPAKLAAPPAPLVLVVDDHEDSRIIARVVLESAGFRVRDAACGVEGLTLAKSLRPDVLLLDLILPGIDGWEVARRLRRDADLNGMPIIALTALAQLHERDIARDAGCDEVLTKPVSPSVIVRTVRSFLTRSLSVAS